MALWGGRFTSGPDLSVEKLSRSVDFDWRLAPYDVRVNIAHVNALQRSKVLSDADAKKIVSALKELGAHV